ncbi:MAG: hypothetical protein KJ629_01470 [Candidatus Omnitrophica bacterium]|nr:hypothetical protein [Candidatus Omnitrophota bacterium]
MKITGEEFKRLGIARLDTKNRVTLGILLKRFKILKETPITDFETFIGDNGDILLRPRVAIPAKELWVHQNPKVLESIQRGMQDIKEGRATKVKDLNKFFEEL